MTKHIENQHPEKHLRDRCHDDFLTISELNKKYNKCAFSPPPGRKTARQAQAQGKKCPDYFNGLVELKSHMKNPAYGRQRISRPMRIVGLIQFWRG